MAEAFAHSLKMEDRDHLGLLGLDLRKGLLIHGTAHLSAKQTTAPEEVWFPQENEYAPRAENFKTSSSTGTEPFGSCLVECSRAQIMRRNTFPSEFRLKRKSEYARVQRGRYYAFDNMVIQWSRSTTEHARLGLTVSRRFGSSVERNLFRRRAREAFRVSALKDMPGLDLNVKPRGESPVSYDDFCRAFLRLEAIMTRSDKRS